MKRGLGLSDDALRDVYNTWNQGELNGYLNRNAEIRTDCLNLKSQIGIVFPELSYV
jgi:6-phosphogluconate dehydrogenase